MSEKENKSVQPEPDHVEAADQPEVKKKKDKASKQEIKELEALKKDLAVLQADNTKLKNDYYKAYADAENYRKRAQRDLDQSMKYRIQSFATTILPALDNFERALAQANPEDPLYQGVQMIYDQLIKALEAEGVQMIDAQDQEFDPNLHHAVMTEHVDGVEPNRVLDVLQKGYVLKDRILRAALVKVSE